MNDELKEIFIEQIAHNINQVRSEMSGEKEHSEEYLQEQVSTGIDNTPPPKAFTNMKNSQYKETAGNFRSIEYDQQDIFQSNKNALIYSENRDSGSLEYKGIKHTYTTPGPILINPHNNERRTLPPQKGSEKIKGTQSCINISRDGSEQNRPHINSQSILLANRKRIPVDSVHKRLHNEALNKQKIERRNKAKAAESSYEASTIVNGSFHGNKSTQRKSRRMFESARTEREYRNDTNRNQ